MSNHFISVQTAKEYTARFRQNKDKITTHDYQNALPYSETFDAQAIRDILNQEGCVGFRTYFGMNENNEVCVIFVGVDDKNEDILTNDIIVEKGKRCPDDCNYTPL